MFKNLIERLDLLEWYDNLLKYRIKHCKDEEIKEIYREGAEWCEKTRIQLSKKIIGG